MRLIGNQSRKARAERVVPTPEEEYEVVADEESRLRAQIRNLEGFIDEAPHIREERKLETQVTLPPLEDEGVAPEQVAAIEYQSSGEDDDGDEDLGERVGRRHLAAIKRARRKNFCIFLVSAAAVAAFLYWVSLVVQ